MKSVNLSVLPNYVVCFVGVDVEFVLSCRSDPLGRDGSKQNLNSMKKSIYYLKINPILRLLSFGLAAKCNQ